LKMHAPNTYAISKYQGKKQMPRNGLGNNINKWEQLILSETVEVVGCTEPAAIAFAYAKINQYLTEKLDPQKIKAQLFLSSDVFRNASTAGIPAINKTGIAPAVALGIFSNNPELNLFAKITKNQLSDALKLLKRKNWLAIIRQKRKGIFIKARIITPEGTYESIINQKHNNLVSVRCGNRLIFRGSEQKNHRIKTLNEIRNIVRLRNNKLETMAENILLKNGRESEKIKHNSYMDTVYELIKKRMEGKWLKIVTIAGSGNQGIFLSIPFYYLYKKSGKQVIPAFLFSLLTLIYLAQKKGKLGKRCGLSTKAAPALIAGFAFMKNKSPAEIAKKMKLAEEYTREFLCEGAEKVCADKSYVCLASVKKIQSDKILDKF